MSRIVGTVKWFGGKNRQTGKENRFGFISIQGRDGDIYVSQNDLLTDSTSLYEDVPVTLKLKAGRGGEFVATEVKLLLEEDDLEALLRALSLGFAHWHREALKRISELARQENRLSFIVSLLEEAYLGGAYKTALSSNLNALSFSILKASKVLWDALSLADRVRLHLDQLSENASYAWEDELVNLIERLPSSEAVLFGRLPSAMIARHERIRARLPISIAIKYYSEQFKMQSVDESSIRETTNELMLLAQQTDDESDWRVIPADLIYFLSGFWDHAPMKTRVEVLSQHLDDELLINRPHIVAFIADGLRAKNPSISTMLPKLGREIKEDSRIRLLLPPDEQVNLVWPIDRVSVVWPSLSAEGQLLLIYRLASHGKRVGEPERVLGITSDIRARSAISILRGKPNPDNQKAVFRAFHDDFQNHVISRAWDVSQEIKLDYFLPECAEKASSHVELCEGRHLDDLARDHPHSGQVSRAWCPRLRKPCSVSSDGCSRPPFGLFGARRYSNRNLPWHKWTLLELIEDAGIDVDINYVGLRRADEYVNRLCGWINRLNEIRKHIRCRCCESPMRANYEYAKNLASYGATIFSCPAIGGHDTDVYLSHCWACRSLIDSRDCRIRANGYYLCLACGSGELKSTLFTQGDRCPRCGKSDMEPTRAYESFSPMIYLDCMEPSCQHRICLPRKQNLTGPRAELRAQLYKH